ILSPVRLPVPPLRPGQILAARQGDQVFSSDSGNERWARGGTRKFCRRVVRRMLLKPCPSARGGNGSVVPSGSTPSIALRTRWKSSLVGEKTTGWAPAAGSPEPLPSAFHAN